MSVATFDAMTPAELKALADKFQQDAAAAEIHADELTRYADEKFGPGNIIEFPNQNREGKQ